MVISWLEPDARAMLWQQAQRESREKSYEPFESWATVGFYVLFGIWMLACAGIVTWIAVARRRDSS